MRFTLIVSAFAALALAAPRPQDIDFDLVDAAPDPILDTAPSDVTSETVPIQPVAAAIAVADQSVTEVAQTTEEFSRRGELVGRDGNCAAQPAGTGPRVTIPDDSAASFLSWQPFKDNAIAAAAPAQVPPGYSLAFSNLKGSSQTVSYLGFKTISQYDPVACASYCDKQAGCIAFNLYYERDPSVHPDATDCPDPTSVTNIKCVRWGIAINATTATNTGQYRDSFKVVISGSNGYNKNAGPAPQPGFSGPTALRGAINAPNDPITNTNTYMGYKFFSFATVQTFANGAVACTSACTSQTAYNSRHPPSTGKPSVCNQVVVYVLNQADAPQGIYCAMYSEAWAPAYATNYGQYRGNEYWRVSQAYSYTNAAYAATHGPICDVEGCPDGSYRGGNCGGWGAGTC
ncbi:hypothetical protein LZ554_007363 [Drepanopeziza brunnea f. sp. 'monogermtubi']|nr:hypothetical protein LZ554_007363 [Drepanopeziza brunnea f. sp. 'monogermtubi']